MMRLQYGSDNVHMYFQQNLVLSMLICLDIVNKFFSEPLKPRLRRLCFSTPMLIAARRASHNNIPRLLPLLTRK